MKRAPLALLALIACGGEPTFVPPVDPSLPVAGLDAASIAATCETLAEFEDQVIDRDTRSKLFYGERNAFYGHLFAEPSCSTIRDEDLLDDLGSVISCNLHCIARFDQCTATVADFAGCAEARVFAAKERTESFQCRLRDTLPPPKDPEACRTLRQQCRDSATAVPADRVRCRPRPADG